MSGIPREEYERQVAERWAGVNVVYHGDNDPEHVVVKSQSVFNQTPQRRTFAPHEELHTNQWTIDDEHLPIAAKNDEPTTVMHINGKHFVFDGNHRVMGKRMHQEPVKADVYDVRPQDVQQ